MPKANGSAVIYSRGQMEGQTRCHHGYSIKLWTSSPLAQEHAASVPELPTTPRAPANQPSTTNMHLLPRIITPQQQKKKPRQDDTNDLADRLDGRAAKKKNPRSLLRCLKRSGPRLKYAAYSGGLTLSADALVHQTAGKTLRLGHPSYLSNLKS